MTRMDTRKKSITNYNLSSGTILFKEEVYKIVGAAFEVHNQLGCGFLEPVYQEALEKELTDNGIPFVPQQELRISYKGQLLKKIYIADFVLYDEIIVEIKSEEHLSSIDEAQLLNYLSATGKTVGVLINFGSKRLEWKRFINT